MSFGQVVLKSLETRRDEPNWAAVDAFNLGVSDAKVYQWCGKYGIDI